VEDTSIQPSAVDPYDLESCSVRSKRNFYVRDIFERISSHPQNRLAELLPHWWVASRQAVIS
jgi:hypothetical protein